MLSQASQHILASFARTLEHRDRFVDVGVRIEIVRRDRAGNLETIETKTFGGIVDTAAKPPHIVRDTENPITWQCSEEQWAAIEHPDSDPPGTLLVAGMGSGKTVAITQWLYLRWLEHLGRGVEGGICAPTGKRLNLVLREIFNRWPRSWWRYQQASNVVTLCDGTSLRAVSTTQKSSAAGSPLQGWNFSFVACDELQDSVEQVTHIQARLRSAESGRGKRIGTATAKDDPAWRDCKDSLLSSGVWQLRTLIGPNSPFVAPAHWDAMKRMTTERDYRRLVLAEDLPPESRLYSTWSREHNLIPIPLGARKITSTVLFKKTGDYRDVLLMGHDPGVAKSATVWIDAYELSPKLAALHGLPANEPLFWVRAELLTNGDTVEVHATKALAITRDRFGVNIRHDEGRAHVRTQPLGLAEDKPDQSVLAIWRRVGFDIKVAQYSKHGAPTGNLPRESRIAAINMAFCDAAGRRRLFIEPGAAPKLVAALESMERDHRGRAESDKKDIRHDKSDLPCALGYALWPWLKENSVALRGDIRKAIAT